MAPNRIIIDTDPGIDDVLAMLLAFAARPEELEVLLISITFGNIDVQSCLKNVLALFYTIQREQSWRQTRGLPLGFASLGAQKPIVAIGADKPLADQLIMADYFHGKDGLGNIKSLRPDLAPTDAWYEANQLTQITASSDRLFTPSTRPAHEEILHILRTNEPNTITIVAIGPLTNLARAAAADPVTFLRVKEVAVMGGAISEPGNITPLAEFNTHADTVAFARVLALTSPHPASTMPPKPPVVESKSTSPQPQSSLGLPDYPEKLPSQLKVTLFPLDITTPHLLTPEAYEESTKELLVADSPLAVWVTAFMKHAFSKSIEHGRPGLSLHDPLTVWYAMRDDLAATSKTSAATPTQGSKWRVETDVDVRVETSGQWTRGACIVDRRGRSKKEGDVPGDRGGWLGLDKGNRVGICVGSPGETLFEKVLLDRIFHPTK